MLDPKNVILSQHAKPLADSHARHAKPLHEIRLRRQLRAGLQFRIMDDSPELSRNLRVRRSSISAHHCSESIDRELSHLDILPTDVLPSRDAVEL